MLAAGKSQVEVLQKLKVKESTWMRWKKQHGDMRSDEAKRHPELELENRRLKGLLAEPEPDKEILKEALEGNYKARLDDVRQSSICEARVRFRSVGSAGCWSKLEVHSDTCLKSAKMNLRYSRES